jgi:phage terminase large subunit GpA-like protein
VDVKVDGKRDPHGASVKTVKVSFFKGELYALLKLRAPTLEERAELHLGFPPGYCHFPTGPNYGDEHFKQLTAEQLVTRKNRRTGRMVLEYVPSRPRNEALDCRIYARAAAWDFGLDQAQEEHWAALEAQLIAIVRPPPLVAPARPSAEAEDKYGWKDRDDRQDSGPYIERQNWFRKSPCPI